MRIKIYLLLALLWPGLSMCQDITIRGKVIDEEGKPISKATVKVIHQGEKIAGPKEHVTITDEKGEWNMKGTRLNDLIIVSAAGYETVQEPNNERGSVTITLKRSAKLLDEVKLETGYEQIARERATGSFSQVSEARFNEVTGTNVLDRLPYMTNGLAKIPERVISGNGALLIRGFSSFSVTDILVVVDNFPYSGNLDNLNPNDVESITVLKDAAAASIWGAKSGNGVLVITTKKGKFNQKTKVEFNANFSTKGEPDLLSRPIISTSEFIDVEQFLFSKGFKFSDTSNVNRPSFSPVYEILFKLRKGQITQAQSDAQINAFRTRDIRNEYLKYFYRPSFNQQYAINVRGGSQNNAWMFSAGVDRNRDNLDNIYNRYSFAFNNTYRITKKLELAAAITFMLSEAEEGNPAYGSMTSGKGAPYFQFADSNGKANPFYLKYRQGYIDTLGAGKLLDWNYYPMTDHIYQSSKDRYQHTSALMGINYKLFSWLTADIKYGYTRENRNHDLYYDVKSYFARDLINMYSQLNRTTGIVTYKVPFGGIFDQFRELLQAHNLRGQINVNKNLGNHSIHALFGGEIREEKRYEDSYRLFGYDPSTLLHIDVDYVNPYPLFTGGSSNIPNSMYSSAPNTRFVSVFSNAGYTYKQRYGITISGRKDASNLFGLNINDKWTPMWSLGALWIISSEKFFKVPAVSYLKFRATYGHTGNVDPEKVAVLTLNIGSNLTTQYPQANVNNFPNPWLSWEQVGILNLGIDFKCFNNRISGSIEWFKKDIKDLHSTAPLDPTTGLARTTISKNIGTMDGKGMDIELNTINIDKPIKWTSNLIFNLYKDHAHFYMAPSTTASSKVGVPGGSLDGYERFAYFAYAWGGLNDTTGDPQGYLNGQLSTNYSQITGAGTKFSDIVYIGRQIPLISGSFGNSVSWKAFSVTVRMQYEFGYYFSRPSISYNELFNSAQGHSDFSKRWQKPGDAAITNVPSMIYPNSTARDAFYKNSEILATKGNNIRLRYINISYSIPEKWLQKIKMASASLYIVLNEVGILWKANKYGLDPDNLNEKPARFISAGIRMNL